MNDEIKEILNRLDFNEWEVDLYKVPITWSELYTIRDYITNLQQENLSLAKENEQEKQFIKDCGFENVQQLALDYIGIRQEKENYKSRIEKAVKYLKNNCFIDKCCIKYEAIDITNVMDILNGRSDE